MKQALWVSQVYPTSGDAMLGSFLHRLAREMPRLGWRVHVLAPGLDGSPDKEELDGVTVHRFRYGSPGHQRIAYTGEMHLQAIRHPLEAVRFLRMFLHSVRTEIETGRPDVIHAHWWVPSGFVAVRAARGSGIPIALSCHGTDIRLAREIPLLKPAAAWVLRAVDLALPVSPVLANEICRIEGRSRKVIVLPMPADSRVFFPAGETEPGGPSRWQGGRIEFTIAARLTRQKRVELAIRAIADLVSRGLDLRLNVAGDGSDRTRLQRVAQEVGVSDRIVFHGVLTPTGLADLLRASRGFVLPSVGEGYGLSVVEAGLCGTPAVGVRSGGLADIIADGETGYLAAPDDLASLVAAMAKLSADGESARSMGGKAFEKAQGLTEGPLAERLALEYEALRIP